MCCYLITGLLYNLNPYFNKCLRNVFNSYLLNFKIFLFQKKPQHHKFIHFIANEILFVHTVIKHHNPRMIIFGIFSEFSQTGAISYNFFET